MNVFRFVLIVLGTLSLALGIIGIFVPGLPTTPFILLTAGLYMRSSDRLYKWVINNRFVGGYVNDFQKSKSIPFQTKLYSIAMMWTMIGISTLFFIESLWGKGLVVLAGVVGTVVVGFVIKTRKPY